MKVTARGRCSCATSRSLEVLPALASLAAQRGETWRVLTGGAFVAMAVPLTVFFALQRCFVRGVTAGSVKG